MKISIRIVIGFLVIVCLTTVAGIYSIYQLSAVSKTSTVIASDSLPSISNALKMKVTLARYRLSELQHILAHEDDVLLDEAKSLDVRYAEIKKYHSAYDTLVTAQEDKDLSNEFDQTLAKYVEEDKKVVALSAEQKKEEARLLIRAESTLLYRKLNAQIDKMVKTNEERSVKFESVAGDTYVSSRGWIVGLLAANAAIGVFLAFWLAKTISKPVVRATQVAKRVASGDFSEQIMATSSDETGQLLSALQAMQENLSQVVTNVREGAESVSMASAEIAHGNNDLSARTEQQASAIEETSASMEELNSQVKQNADSAKQANQLAANASNVAKRGGEVVGKVVHTMKDINDASRKISDIIGVIDGIAFQTNILALNAAVEAARAGEQGRGFAVVASEVRSLAGRSADAAKEIKSLINASVEKVEQGSVLVDEAGSTMTEVVASIQQVTDIMAEINSASREQAAGVTHVSEAVNHMDQATQQNAALVEEMAAAASSLKSQASDLVQTVAVFKLGASGGTNRANAHSDLAADSRSRALSIVR